MALKPCPECGKEVSDRAPTCPQCGAPLSGPTVVDPELHGRGEGIFMKSLNCGCMVGLGLVGLVIFVVFLAYVLTPQ